MSSVRRRGQGVAAERVEPVHSVTGQRFGRAHQRIPGRRLDQSGHGRLSVRGQFLGPAAGIPHQSESRGTLKSLSPLRGYFLPIMRGKTYL